MGILEITQLPLKLFLILHFVIRDQFINHFLYSNLTCPGANTSQPLLWLLLHLYLLLMLIIQVNGVKDCSALTLLECADKAELHFGKIGGTNLTAVSQFA